VQRACKLLSLACLALPLSAAVAFAEGPSTNSPASAANQTAKADAFVQPKTLAELLALPPDQLEKVDIGRIDLLCAEGLPGAEDLDVEKCIETLDGWARYVKTETDKNYHRFVEHPEKFKNSSGRYQMGVMAAALSEDLRVQYNPAREKELLENGFLTNRTVYGEAERSFFSDSSDVFLHGLLSQRRYGTCASLPYLYVAVGRRLGYPVSIAGAHMHSYVYYDEGGGKHFNVEATENRAFVTPSDESYMRPAWGAPSSPEYYEKRGLLRPMSNKEAMGHILAERAAVFRSAGRHDEEAKTWATAARYFPDTPTWREIAENMQQCARLDEYQKWRHGVWKELASYYIPHGPGFAYFHDRKIKLHLFMNESLDKEAVERAANEYKKELSEYSSMVMPLPDSGKVALTITNRPPPGTPQLYFFYRPPDGNQVKVPADFMPPFPQGELPMELKARIVNSKPQDPDTLLEMVWEHYEQMQATELAKQRAEVERIVSGNPILISEESIPPEFRRGVPMELGMRLSGLHSAQDIVMEMWQYKQQQAARQQGMLGDPTGQLGAILRQAGIPDSVARTAGLPVAAPQGPDDAMASALRQAGIPDSVAQMSGLGVSGSHGAGLPGMDGMPGLNPLEGFPGMQGLAAQGLVPGGNPRPFTVRDGWAERRRQANEQAMETIVQQMRPSDGMKPGYALPYQVVPAAVAAKNPAVRNPLPFGGSLNSPMSSPLTVPPQTPITTSTNRSNAP